MDRKRLLTIIGCITFVMVSAFIGKSFATSDPNALDAARAEQLMRQITELELENKTIQPLKERNQARCTQAAQQEKQMTTNNVSINAKRDELNFLTTKMDPPTAVR